MTARFPFPESENHPAQTTTTGQSIARPALRASPAPLERRASDLHSRKNHPMHHHDQRPLLGLCPIGKFVFSHADAVRLKQELQAALRGWKVRFVDLDAVLPDGLVREQSQVDTVVRHFRQKEIDCLFLPHCNFGTEGAAGMIALQLLFTYAPFMNKLFHTAPISASAWLRVVAVALVAFVVVEIEKAIRARVAKP